MVRKTPGNFMQDLSVILDFPIVLDTKLRLIGDREFRITCRVFALSPGVYLLFFSDFNPIHSEWALVICLDQRSEVKSRSDAVKLGQTLSEICDMNHSLLWQFIIGTNWGKSDVNRSFFNPYPVFINRKGVTRASLTVWWKPK